MTRLLRWQSFSFLFSYCTLLSFQSVLFQSCGSPALLFFLFFSYERCGSSFLLPGFELLFFRLLEACPHSLKVCWLRQTYCCHFQPLFPPYAWQHVLVAANPFPPEALPSCRGSISFKAPAPPPVHLPSDGSGIFIEPDQIRCARP